MLRQIISSTILLSLTSPAFAAQIEKQAKPSQAVVFPHGAVIEWNVTLNDSPGKHQLLLPNIPRNIDPDSIRVTAEGATIGAVTLQSEPPSPSAMPEPQTITDARAKIRDLEEELTNLHADIAASETAAEAWRSRAEMVRDMMRGDTRIGAEELDRLANDAGGLISDYLTKATEEMHKAKLTSHQQGELQRKLEKAEAALAEAIEDHEKAQLLQVTLQQSAPEAKITVTAFTDQAGWAPSYDLHLTRDSGELMMDRSLAVWQNTGADWQDVTLRFSTARPQGQSAPTQVPPYIVEFAKDHPVQSLGRAAPMMEMAALAADQAYAEELVATTAELANIGMTVTYNYSTPVTVHSDADALRLSLDQKTLQTGVLAQVAPRFDDTAFVVTEGPNDTGEPILPGNTNLYLDGALVGRGQIPLTADGDDLHIGFGPIDAITAEFRSPEEQTGESGLINRKNQRTQTETLIVRNLTDEEWPLRVVDRAPVSKQEDLQISWDAAPQPTEQNPDGRRGVLYWEAPIKPGETREISIQSDIRWPEGKEVIR